jgi:hypothetical protein
LAFRRKKRKKKKKKSFLSSLSPQTIVQSEATVAVPELQGELTVSIANYDGREYWACLKNGAAAPAAAGKQHWDEPLYCTMVTFTNSSTTSSFAAEPSSRARRAVPANLRGVGSSADAAAADVVSGVALGVASSVSSRRRRSAPGAFVRGSVSVNVPAGNYFITVAAKDAQAANTTLAFQLSGQHCANVGEVGANCTPLPKIVAGTSFTFPAVPVNGTSWAQLDNYQQINGTTASVTIVAQVDTADSTVAVVARAGAFPSATVFDASIPVTKAFTPVTATLLAPRAAPWYFAIVNTNTSAVVANITVTFKQCGTGAFGADCNTQINATGAAGVAADAAVTAGQQLYFSFSRYSKLALLESAGPAALSIAAAQTVDVDANVNATAPAVYARRGALPTPTQFDYIGCTVSACPDDQTTMIVSAESIYGNANDTWYVLVVPSVAGTAHVWNAAGGVCANNCTSTADVEQGRCNLQTATCSCDDGFASFDCKVAVSALERWEWALIIGGAVLVAIGLIGCIVYFIQRQSRRQGFERV